MFKRTAVPRGPWDRRLDTCAFVVGALSLTLCVITISRISGNGVPHSDVVIWYPWAWTSFIMTIMTSLIAQIIAAFPQRRASLRNFVGFFMGNLSMGFVVIVPCAGGA